MPCAGASAAVTAPGRSAKPPPVSPREELYQARLREQQQELRRLQEERLRLMEIQGKIQDLQWACPDLQVLAYRCLTMHFYQTLLCTEWVSTPPHTVIRVQHE